MGKIKKKKITIAGNASWSWKAGRLNQSPNIGGPRPTALGYLASQSNGEEVPFPPTIGIANPRGYIWGWIYYCSPCLKPDSPNHTSTTWSPALRPSHRFSSRVCKTWQLSPSRSRRNRNKSKGRWYRRTHQRPDTWLRTYDHNHFNNRDHSEKN